MTSDSNEIFRNGIRYVPSKVAAKNVGLVPDYISRMCRTGAVRAIRHAGIWYLDEDSLATFLKNQSAEYEQFKKRKSADGKAILRQRALPVHHRVITHPHPTLRNEALRAARHVRIVQTATAALATLFIVASSALAFEYVAPEGSAARIAITSAFKKAPDQIAAAASIPLIDSLASKVFSAVCPFFGSCPSAPQIAFVPSPAKTAQTNPTPTTLAQRPSSSVQQPVQQTIITNPVVERIRETVRTVTEGGVNAAYVDERMAALSSSLLSQINTVAAASHNESQTIYQTVGMVGRIEELTDTKLHSPTIDGGTISGATISGGSITATDFSGVLAIAKGGTGTSSSPSYGQMLLGDGTGGYSLVATSSLGIVGGGGGSGLSSYDAFSHPAAGISATTSLLVLNGAASTTLFSAVGKSYFGGTATTTIDTAGNVAVAGTLDVTGKTTLGTASTTQISATYASSTSGFFGNLSIGSLSGFLKATAGTIATALVDLASNVTGILPVANGGTGWGNLASGAIVLGNGTGPVATTSAGTNGQVLGLLNGTPSWVATTTAGIGLSYDGSSFNVNTTQNISRLSNLTTNGFVKTSGGNGTLSVDTATYLTNSLTKGNFIVGNDAGVAQATSSIYISSTGQIGIGTQSPAQQFVVNGTGPIVVQSQNSGSSNYAGIYLQTDDTAYGARLKTGIFATGDGAWGVSDMSFAVNGVQDNNNLNLANDTRMIIKSNGEIGIGTTSPAALLSLQGSDTSASTYSFLIANSASTTLFKIGNTGIASTTALVISNTGGSGTRCLQVGADGTVSANASACASGGLSSYDAFTHPTAGQSATTSTMLFSSGASTTNFSTLDTIYIGRTATTTIRGDGLASTIPFASTTMITATTASSTNLFVSGVAGSLLKTNSNGQVAAAVAGIDYLTSFSYDAWTHPAAGQSATTSLMLFNGAASSTMFSAATGYFNLINATSTTATSTFSGMLAVGSNALNVLSNGYVGIGTAIPAAPLHVHGSIANGAQEALRISGGGTSNTSAVSLVFQPAYGTNAPFSYPTWKNAEIQAINTQTGVSGYGGALAFFTNVGASPTQTTEKMRIDSAGNVGIAQTSPTYKLDVTGNGHFTSLVDASYFVATSSNIASSLPFASTTMITATTASTTNLWISGIASGSLLKTTTGGQVTAAVAGTDYLTSFSYDAFTHPAAGQSATTSLTLFNGNASTTMFSAYSAYFGGTATSTFTSTGLLGIGTTSPFAKLSVHALNGETNNTLFAIASSTASATTTLFSVSNTGATTIGGALTISGGLSGVTTMAASGLVSTSGSNFSIGGGGTFGYIWSGSTRIRTDSGDGTLVLYNNAGTDFTRLQFGGTTSAFPALGVNTGSQSLYVGLGNGALGGKFGVGTSTPWGKVAINLDNGESNTNAFIIASSTASATTTLFSIDNTGTASTTNLTVSGLGAASCDVKSTNGVLSCGTDATGGSAYDAWTHPAAGQSATTSLMLFNGAASTTMLSAFQGAYFGGTATSTFSSTGLLTLPSGFLSLASSTIGNGTQAGGLMIDGGATTTGIITMNTISGTSNLFKLDTSRFLSASSSAYSIFLGIGAGGGASEAGKDNIAFGSSTLSALTTGNRNIAIGGSALKSNTTGLRNIAIGANSLSAHASSASDMIVIGDTVAPSYNASTGGFIGIGTNALQSITSGTADVAIGGSSQNKYTGGSTAGNVAVGGNTLSRNTTGDKNVAIGGSAGFGSSAGTPNSDNVFIGYQAGYQISSGKGNIVIGAATTSNTISNITTGSLNILMGAGISAPSATANGQLDIQNILYGTNNLASGSAYSTGQLGVGSTSPFARFTIHANNGDTNTSLFAIASSTASATSTLFTISNTGIASTTGLVISNTGGSGTRCLQVGSDGTLSANASACGTGSGSVTSVGMTVPAFLSISGSPVTTSGTLAVSLSGTALPVANGGTGVTSSTGSGNVVLSSSPTITTPLFTLSSSAGSDDACYNTGNGALTYASACTASDQRLKENIVDLPEASGLDAIMHLHPVNFDWKDAQLAAQKGRQTGFIAQELQTVFPDLVFTGSTTTIVRADGTTETIYDTLAIDYKKLVVPTIKAVQELNLKFENLATTSVASTSTTYLTQGQFNSATSSLYTVLHNEIASTTASINIASFVSTSTLSSSLTDYAKHSDLSEYTSLVTLSSATSTLYSVLHGEILSLVTHDAPPSSDLAFLSATTSAVELVTASSSVSTTTPWIASFATSSSPLQDAITALGDAIIHVLGRAVYAVTGIFEKIFVKELTVQNVYADTVNAKKLCLDDICITKDELKELLDGKVAGSATTTEKAIVPTPQSTPALKPLENTGTSTPEILDHTPLAVPVEEAPAAPESATSTPVLPLDTGSTTPPASNEPAAETAPEATPTPAAEPTPQVPQIEPTSEPPAEAAPEAQQ